MKRPSSSITPSRRVRARVSISAWPCVVDFLCTGAMPELWQNILPCTLPHNLKEWSIYEIRTRLDWDILAARLALALVSKATRRLQTGLLGANQLQIIFKTIMGPVGDAVDRNSTISTYALVGLSIGHGYELSTESDIRDDEYEALAHTFTTPIGKCGHIWLAFECGHTGTSGSLDDLRPRLEDKQFELMWRAMISGNVELALQTARWAHELKHYIRYADTKKLLSFEASVICMDWGHFNTIKALWPLFTWVYSKNVDCPFAAPVIQGMADAHHDDRTGPWVRDKIAETMLAYKKGEIQAYTIPWHF